MKYILIITILFLFSCHERTELPPCVKTKGKATLVAYRVAKHSHLWLKSVETGIIYDIPNLGGRREPNINLGDTINVAYCNGELLFDRYDYVRIPENRTTRTVKISE